MIRRYFSLLSGVPCLPQIDPLAADFDESLAGWLVETVLGNTDAHAWLLSAEDPGSTTRLTAI